LRNMENYQQATCGNIPHMYSAFGIRNIRYQDYSFPGTFVPRTVRSWEFSFPGTNKLCKPFPALQL